MKILSLKAKRRTPSRAPAASYHTARMQFRQWLIFELRMRGADLPDRPSYRALQDACQRYLVPRP